jgi:hypothetical protein
MIFTRNQLLYKNNIINSNILLIDAICSDNDYVLTFQATEEVRELVSILIDIRDDTISDTKNPKLLLLLNQLHKIVQIITEEMQMNKHDADYLRDVRYGFEKSLSRVALYLQ